MNLEDERVGQLPRVVEPPLGTRLRLDRHVLLPQRDAERGENGKRRGAGDRDDGFVARRKPADDVA